MNKKIKILIAEDHGLVREAWDIILNADPRFTVIGLAENGEKALELAKQLRPDIVIMDINMPGMDGFEATKQIRTYSPGSKILAVSIH
jgi:two-component system invasion response regulator UvrY